MRTGIALGSNRGDRLNNLQAAARELQTLAQNPVRRSKVYETTPVDCPPNSPKFLNAVVELDVGDVVSPHDLLWKLKAIETKLGRKPKHVHNEPRPIDLDLIYCGTSQAKTPDLVVPHPRAHLRRFVLQPLCDLSPDLVLPGHNKTVRELLAALPPDQSVRLHSSSW